jgi:LPXTG-motif cell wall-anchored protein
VQPPAPQPPIASPPGGTLPTTGSTGLVNTLMLAGLSIGGGAMLLRVRRRA